ncbi:hypothetical protein [Paraliobacillus sp. X-1268]|uniref:beta family protein n=1 Tax=Paraliobacillus sp. X-1268 TaxID=2213193 RepID=UPI000E3D2F41|nr:hypothetical protein [Paraliobacillus sp. X-1268]
MYIPIMKNRGQELKVTENMNTYFSDSIIPLFELIRDEFEDNFQIDESGDYIYQIPTGKKRRSKIRLPRKKDDIITLKALSDRLKEKNGFVDFFRFKENEYKNYDVTKIDLSFRLNRDFNYYRSRVLEISNFKNLIPVISIKDGFKISEPDLYNLIIDLRKMNPSIGIRITADLLESYSEFIDQHTTKEDYLMLDIREQKAESKFIEIEELNELTTQASKVLLNSPRLRENTNGVYENLTITKKIDNSVAEAYLENKLCGFGDFGGLKDDLPSIGGGGGKGSALALMYIKEKNAFYSIVNSNGNLGVRGYEYVVSELLKKSSILDSEKDCLSFKHITEKSLKGSYGNWQTWTSLILTRYIQQQATK